MTPGIGPSRRCQTPRTFRVAEAVYGATRVELEKVPASCRKRSIALSLATCIQGEGEIENVRKLGGDILVLDDGVYPSLLREIYDPPIALYVKGAWSECLDQPCVAIVGSRKCSTYGQNAP